MFVYAKAPPHAWLTVIKTINYNTEFPLSYKPVEHSIKKGYSNFYYLQTI